MMLASSAMAASLLQEAREVALNLQSKEDAVEEGQGLSAEQSQVTRACCALPPRSMRMLLRLPAPHALTASAVAAVAPGPPACPLVLASCRRRPGPLPACFEIHCLRTTVPLDPPTPPLRTHTLH